MKVEHAINLAQSGSHQGVYGWTFGLFHSTSKLQGKVMSYSLTCMTQVRLLFALKLEQGGIQALCASTGHGKSVSSNIPQSEARGRSSQECSNCHCSPPTQSEALL